MAPFLELAFILATILLAAKLAGYVSSRLGQPSVLGELVVGLLLGPSLLNLTQLSFIHDGQMLDTTITELGELGILLLMFLAGLELHLSDLARSSRVSALSGILGVSGITILPSTGLARLRKKNALRDDLPLIPRIEDILQHAENSNRTLFTIVHDEEMVDKVVPATQEITGDLNLPNTGILVVLPVARAYGVDRKSG